MSDWMLSNGLEEFRREELGWALGRTDDAQVRDWRHSIYCGVQAGEPCNCKDETLCRVCSHGKAFDVHCKRCALEGFCGCPECEAGDSNPDDRNFVRPSEGAESDARTHDNPSARVDQRAEGGDAT